MGEIVLSGYVQFWDVRNENWAFLIERATERGIEVGPETPAELRAILALWEFSLPRDDPLLGTLIKMVPLTYKDMKEQLKKYRQTKCLVLDAYIKDELQKRTAKSAP